MKTQSKKELSIQINLSGLSFCILDRPSETVVFLKSISFDNKANPHEVLTKLKTVIETHSVFEQQFSNVTCIFQNELSCLVPKHLFDEAHLADYLKFNAKILKTDFITYDPLKNRDIVTVYVPLVNINNYIFDTFGSFTYKHSSTVLIETILNVHKKSDVDTVHLNINAESYELIVIKNSELQFYNSFKYHTKEDFIYYLLFTIEQLKLDTETLKLFFTGQITKEDDLFQLAYKYVRYAELLEVRPKYNLKELSETNLSHTNGLNHFLILNSFH